MQNNFSVNALHDTAFYFTTLRKLMEFLTYTEFEQQFWKIIETLHFMSSFSFEPILAKTFKDWRMCLIKQQCLF